MSYPKIISREETLLEHGKAQRQKDFLNNQDERAWS
jgi:hypothetical protein